MAGTASADTLREALVSAYNTNPTLMTQRETQKVTDANVAIAKAAGRPEVSGTVGLNRNLTRYGILDTGGSRGPMMASLYASMCCAFTSENASNAFFSRLNNCRTTMPLTCS